MVRCSHCGALQMVQEQDRNQSFRCRICSCPCEKIEAHSQDFIVCSVCGLPYAKTLEACPACSAHENAPKAIPNDPASSKGAGKLRAFGCWLVLGWIANLILWGLEHFSLDGYFVTGLTYEVGAFGFIILFFLIMGGGLFLRKSWAYWLYLSVSIWGIIQYLWDVGVNGIDIDGDNYHLWMLSAFILFSMIYCSCNLLFSPTIKAHFKRPFKIGSRIIFSVLLAILVVCEVVSHRWVSSRYDENRDVSSWQAAAIKGSGCATDLMFYTLVNWDIRCSNERSATREQVENALVTVWNFLEANRLNHTNDSARTSLANWLAYQAEPNRELHSAYQAYIHQERADPESFSRKLSDLCSHLSVSDYLDYFNAYPNFKYTPVLFGTGF